MVLLSLLSFVVAVAALAIVLVVLGAIRKAEREAVRPEDVPPDVHALREEVATLRAESSGSLRHLAVVRYDAFGDLGGRLSWSVALLDDSGDGVVLSSIHARTESRSYVKSVAGWRSDQELSEEEAEAVANARP